VIQPLAALAAVTIVLGATFAPALARDSYVVDDAHLLSAGTISTINAKIATLYAVAHKEVVVVIEPKVTAPAGEAAEQLFVEQRVNGVLIFIAMAPKTIGIVPDMASETFFPTGTTDAIHQAIAGAFNSGDYNGGVTNGVDLVLDQYRSHLSTLRTAPVAVAAPVVVASQTGGGFNMGVIWWLIALAVIFFVVRGIFRAMSGPRMSPPGYGGGPMGPAGPIGGGYGGGYGPGYGYGGGGGGGGFWSGMLGGLGGAFLGNELFGGNRFGGIEQNPGMTGGMGGGEFTSGGGVDTSGFQSDPGQADMGNASIGGWGGGDSGGGWGDLGGGGGDSGGGGW
jgi:hypothetical protein